MPHEELPYWHFNVTPAQRTEECPESLKDISEKDKKLIGTWDSNYERQSWDEVRDIIAINRIDLFRRAPSDLRKYRQFVHYLNNNCGGVQRFILQNRLHWASLVPHGAPFEHPEDWQILYNDWPYGVDPRIVHLVVWTKFSLPDNQLTGDMTDEIRDSIDSFISKTFGEVTGKDNVLWFRNWKCLKSVESVEHFHVMLFNPDPSFVADITGDDRPYSTSFLPN